MKFSAIMNVDKNTICSDMPLPGKAAGLKDLEAVASAMCLEISLKISLGAVEAEAAPNKETIFNII